MLINVYGSGVGTYTEFVTIRYLVLKCQYSIADRSWVYRLVP